jgi:hypothetical protein
VVCRKRSGPSLEQLHPPGPAARAKRRAQPDWNLQHALTRRQQKFSTI